MLGILRKAEDNEITIQIQAGFTDVAMLIAAAPELFKHKVGLVSAQGGLQRTSTGEGGLSGSGWEPDNAQNNAFDEDASSKVYSFCFEHNIPMHVVGRNAVPALRMTLAGEHLQKPASPAMQYLYECQTKGLLGLWMNICRSQAARETGGKGILPERCTKQWFLSTFGAMEPEDFVKGGFADQGESFDIEPHLKGTVKPYDVVTFMTLFDEARDWFDFDATEVHIGRTVHHFWLAPQHMCDIIDVESTLSRAFRLCQPGDRSQRSRSLSMDVRGHDAHDVGGYNAYGSDMAMSDQMKRKLKEMARLVQAKVQERCPEAIPTRLLRSTSTA
jgi:hypothetical protein